MRKLVVISIVFALISVLSACSDSSEDKEITIGSKFFTEQFILSKITTFMLEENGYKVNEKENLGSTAVRQALESGEIELTWDYTGTALISYLDEEPIFDGEEAFNKLNEVDQEENGIYWTNKTEINNGFVLVMRSERAEELEISTISDLANYINSNPNELSIGVDAEFGTREDGLPGVEEAYDFEFDAGDKKEMKIGITYDAIDNEDIDVTVGYETDSQIEALNLTILEDDKNFFPPYHGAIAMKEEIYENYPEIIEIFKPLSDNLDSEKMRSLNYKVDIEGKSPDEVAKTFLVENGYIEE